MAEGTRTQGPRKGSTEARREVRRRSDGGVMLTRQVYRDIAESFRIALRRDGSPIRGGQTAYIARMVAADLKRDNRRFRYDLFYEACGLDEFGEVK